MRRTRTELLQLLEPGLGQEAATALLEELEKVDPDRLTTKEDLAATEAALREDLASVNERLASVEARFEGVTSEITNAKNEVLAAVRGEMIDAIATQTRTMQYTLVGAMLSVLAGAATLATFI